VTALDGAAGIAGRRDAPSAVLPFTLRVPARLLRNTNGGTLTADAEVVHRDRMTIVVGVRVCDEDGRLLPRSAMPADR
jgi:acyl-coenzyme A thioesterase PaaI-like protein